MSTNLSVTQGLSDSENIYNAFISGVTLTLSALGLSYAFYKYKLVKTQLIPKLILLAVFINMYKMSVVTYFTLNITPASLFYNVSVTIIWALSIAIVEVIFLHLFLSVVKRRWIKVAVYTWIALLITVNLSARIIFTLNMNPTMILITIINQAIIDCTVVIFALPGIWRVIKQRFKKHGGEEGLENELNFTQSVARYSTATALFAVKMYYIRGSGVFAERSITHLLDSLRIIIILTVLNVKTNTALEYKNGLNNEKQKHTEARVDSKTHQLQLKSDSSQILNSQILQYKIWLNSKESNESLSQSTRNGLNGLYGLDAPLIQMNYESIIVSIGNEVEECKYCSYILSNI